jgi:hypothetical protein
LKRIRCLPILVERGIYLGLTFVIAFFYLSFSRSPAPVRRSRSPGARRRSPSPAVGRRGRSLSHSSPPPRRDRRVSPVANGYVNSLLGYETLKFRSHIVFDFRLWFRVWIVLFLAGCAALCSPTPLMTCSVKSQIFFGRIVRVLVRFFHFFGCQVLSFWNMYYLFPVDAYTP